MCLCTVSALCINGSNREPSVSLSAHHFRTRGPRLCALNRSHSGFPSGFRILSVQAPQLGSADAAPAPFGATSAFADLATAARDAVSGRAALGTDAAPGPVKRPITSCTHTATCGERLSAQVSFEGVHMQLSMIPDTKSPTMTTVAVTTPAAKPRVVSEPGALPGFLSAPIAAPLPQMNAVLPARGRRSTLSESEENRYVFAVETQRRYTRPSCTGQRPDCFVGRSSCSGSAG